MSKISTSANSPLKNGSSNTMDRRTNKMNLALFKSTLKSNWIIVAIFIVILCLYMSSIVAMFDPVSFKAVEEMLAQLPTEIVKAVGMDDLASNPTLAGFVSSYFYGMLIIMFPLIYIGIVGFRMIAKHVSNGSMAYLLSTPNNRVKIAVTQSVYFILSLAVIFFSLTVVSIWICESQFPGVLDITDFVRLNLCSFFMTVAVSAVCYFCSCFFNDAKYAASFGAGLPALSFIFKMMGSSNDGLAWMEKLSIYSFYNKSAIVSGEANSLLVCIIYAMISIALYGAGVVVFKNKDLPL